jgi:hypothetical protein
MTVRDDHQARTGGLAPAMRPPAGVGPGLSANPGLRLAVRARDGVVGLQPTLLALQCAPRANTFFDIDMRLQQ